MTLALAILALVAQQKDDCCSKGTDKPWSGYDAGVAWTQPQEAAEAKAKELNRPLLLFRLVGDLDKEGC